MQRKALAVVLVLLSLAVLTACAAYQAQHAGGSPREAASAPHEHPMHPPSALFTMQSSEEQLAHIHGEVAETKERLAEEGKYACCVRPACNQCLLKYGECRCREAVRKEGPCCGECTEAWVEGRGAVEGVDAWELLERQKQRARDGGGEEKKEGNEKPPHRHWGH
jgi:hypothetical protein